MLALRMFIFPSSDRRSKDTRVRIDVIVVVIIGVVLALVKYAIDFISASAKNVHGEIKRRGPPAVGLLRLLVQKLAVVRRLDDTRRRNRTRALRPVLFHLVVA